METEHCKRTEGSVIVFTVCHMLYTLFFFSGPGIITGQRGFPGFPKLSNRPWQLGSHAWCFTNVSMSLLFRPRTAKPGMEAGFQVSGSIYCWWVTFSLVGYKLCKHLQKLGTGNRASEGSCWIGPYPGPHSGQPDAFCNAHKPSTKAEALPHCCPQATRKTASEHGGFI